MTFVANLSTPLIVVERPAKGLLLFVCPQPRGGLPLDISLTTQEVHLALAGCDGPALVIDLDHILNPAIREFEMLMGVKRSHR